MTSKARLLSTACWVLAGSSFDISPTLQLQLALRWQECQALSMAEC